VKQTPKEKEEEDNPIKPIYVSLQGMGQPRVKGYPCCKAEGLNGVLCASR
jgi:hypothetical protein